MSHPIEEMITKYEKMRVEVCNALDAAGGDSRLIICQTEWKLVMATLLANNIELSLHYKGK